MGLGIEARIRNGKWDRLKQDEQDKQDERDRYLKFSLVLLVSLVSLVSLFAFHFSKKNKNVRKQH